MAKTEVTVQVFEDMKDITSHLENSGFKMIEFFIVNDWYFTKYTDEEISNFEYIDLLNNSLIIRQIIDDKSQVKLIYKRKNIDESGVVVSEDKLSVEVNSLEKILKIFNSLNFNQWCHLSDKCYSYKKGQIELYVQEISNLGNFIEYEETDDMKDMDEYEKINMMSKTIKELGLEIGDDFSCKKVYMKYLKDKKNDHQIN